MFTDFKPKFTKRYARLTEIAVAGIRQYVKEVKEGSFPDDDHSYTVNEADTAVNALLIERGALDIHDGQTIGFVVETQCNYFAPVAFPQTVEAGVRVAQAGRSSVRYEIALFAEGSDTAAAQGHFVHVYVDRATQRPVPLPEALQRVVDSLKA